MPGKKLLIVESPSKAKTISKILGSNFNVLSSVGHIMDLPKDNLGVDIDNNFTPTYILDKKKAKIVKELKKAAKESSEIYVAPDPDREGESIANQLITLLNIKEKKIRVEFNEITPNAIKHGIDNPREVNSYRIDAQQARRVLDRLVGYKISPMLWKLLGYNSSAGRVQSVALKLICELEDSIKKFKPEKYFSVSGIFDSIILDLYKVKNDKIDKLKDSSVIKEIELLIGKDFKVLSKKTSKKFSNPSLPFKTSTLQQAASSEYGISPSKTMKIAQVLYSGVDVKGKHSGLITYIRTDSTRVSEEAKIMAKKYITDKFGAKYYKNRLDKKSDKKIQDAHEAIRPTNIYNEPENIREFLSNDEYRIYRLIYNRFISSQMSDIAYEQMDLIVNNGDFEFRTLLNKEIFDGYRKIISRDDLKFLDRFPDIKDSMKLDSLDSQENETKPPSRYSEASLVKQLEKDGIGRPSTYAAIVENLKLREYVESKDKKFVPTALGYSLKNILNEHFPNIMNIKFTSNMENRLDDIEEGKENISNLLGEFYKDFKKDLDNFSNNIEILKKKVVNTDVICSQCKKSMVLKMGKFGRYLECDNKHKITIREDIVNFDDEKNGFVEISSQLKFSLAKKDGIPTDVVIEGVPAFLKEGPYGYYLESKVDEKSIRQSIPKTIKLDKNIMQQNSVKLKEQIDNFNNKINDIEASAKPCNKCGAKLKVKNGKFGMFLSCSAYPKCKNILKIEK
jgi:DNA topoisomerase-1